MKKKEYKTKTRTHKPNNRTWQLHGTEKKTKISIDFQTKINNHQLTM